MFPKLPPLISGSLPAPQQQGALPLGHVYLRTPPISNFSIPSPTLRDTGKPALEVREVAYSVFYPCEPKLKGYKKWISWVVEPTKGIVEGYEKFVGKSGPGWILRVLGAAAGRISFPAHPLAPLAATSSKYPLIIFSHGLAGTRNTYSNYCAALAASGNVVLAIEHRDGSGPAILNPSSENDGKGELMTYLTMEDLSWSKGDDSSKDHLRGLQLDMRLREVYETYHSFRRLVSSEGGRPKMNDEKADEATTTKFLESITNRIDLENIHLTGHSFGGGTMLHLLQTPPPNDPALAPIPVKRCIALDPWVEPLPIPAPTPEGTLPRVPVFCINSPGFSEWTTHFQRLLKMIKKVDGSFVSLLGASHQSFSDFPLLYPGSTAFALSLLTTAHELSHAFIHGKLAESALVKGKKVDNGDFERNGEGKMAGEKGEAVLHLLGSEDN